jgi:hypothetical protein
MAKISIFTHIACSYLIIYICFPRLSSVSLSKCDFMLIAVYLKAFAPLNGLFCVFWHIPPKNNFPYSFEFFFIKSQCQTLSVRFRWKYCFSVILSCISSISTTLGLLCVYFVRFVTYIYVRNISFTVWKHTKFWSFKSYNCQNAACIFP